MESQFLLYSYLLKPITQFENLKSYFEMQQVIQDFQMYKHA